jgi:hypothetical protein
MTARTIHSEHTSRLIEAFIGRTKEALEVNQDSLPALIREVEVYADTVADAPSAAVLHSMAAEMYEHYYRWNKWNIDQRTALGEFIPEDLREWAPNLFTQKIKKEIKASLLPAEVLQQTPVTVFKAILDMENSAPSLRPTLYDFLAYRAIGIQPSEEIYEDLLAFRRSQPDKKAALLVELDYLQYLNTVYPARREAAYGASLDSLLKVYADKDYSVEVAYAKLNFVGTRKYRMENEDSVLTIKYQLCKDMLARFPQYERINIIRNWLASIEEPVIQAKSDNTVYPGERLEIRLTYRNIKGVTLKVHQPLSQGLPVKEISFPLSLKNSYTDHDTILSLAMEKNGSYEYVLTSPETSLRIANTFSVSRLAAVSRSTDTGQAEVLVTDYRSGKPVENAIVNYYGDNRSKPLWKGSVKTDVNGLALIPERENIYGYQASLPGDDAAPLTHIYAERARKEAEARMEVSLFTDRGLYRPGQTLFFKGIAYINDKEAPRVVPGRSIEVVLRDANYKEVVSQSFTSDSFGSFNGEFTLPRQTLTGTFTLSTAHGSASIQVEEYKRPTFRLELPPVKDEIAFGDEVLIRGKAQTFSGVPLTEGELTYRVILRPFFFRSSYGNRFEEQVAEGKTTVNKEGTFVFAFRPERREQSLLLPLSFQSYEIITALTDSKGETQEARSRFSVGDRSLVLSSDLPDKVDKDSTEILITAHTLNAEAVTTKGTYTLCLLDKTDEDAAYKEVRTLAEGSFTTGLPLSRDVLARLPSGNLRLRLSATDSKGRTVSEQQDFVLYSRHDKRPPIFSHTWLLTHTNECLPGEEAEILFGTSDKDVYLLYELFSKGKNVARRLLRLNNENRTFRIPFTESYGEGVVASFTFIKEGKLYTEQARILRKRPDRKLSLTPETFRDKLLPGSSESWTFRISDAQALPVVAEVLAGMYDASLDYISPLPFAWYFMPERYVSLYYRHFTASKGMQSHKGTDVSYMHEKEVPPFLFERLDWQGALNRPMAMSRSLSGAVQKRLVAAYSPDREEMMANDEMAMEFSATQEPAAGDAESEAGRQPIPPAVPQLRTNFNETAFFFPSLLTDKEGKLRINFRLPESNTTWKLQALAHTADLKYGLMTREIITQKPFMVLPQLPRFLRKGDKVYLSAQVINLSDQEITGKARLELFNPANDELILPVNSQTFSLAPGGTVSLRWAVNVPDAAGLAACRILADSEAGSDGEQHLLPVLPDEVLVTETTPFYLNGEGEKRVKIPEGKASSTRRPHRMTLEFSSNPVWYAVQALPAITQPEHSNIVSWFASYYSNTLAASIARSNPLIRKVVDQWLAEGGTGSTLQSGLEQNEELKNTLLEETPWVLEAKTESEQKQRLALLFDPNRTAMQGETAMRELLRQQHEQGGWGWFKGFYPDRIITLYILRGMSQLSRLGAVQYQQTEKEMQLKALAYLDRMIKKEYEETLRKTKTPPGNYLPSSGQLYYLFVRSAYRDIPEPTDAREAIRYYTEQAGKNWTKASLSEKGEIALLMHRNGRKDIAGAILAWLRKTATVSEEKGMYWANNRRENNYFISPIDVHSLLMTVFRELGADTLETDRMKQWLLNQKRTQNWESVPATVNAIYSLLEGETNWTTVNNQVVLQWGDKTLHTDRGETATGYIKETISGKDITPLMQSLTLRGGGQSPAWGAVYYQYFESLENVEKQKGALHIEKKLFIETNDGRQRRLTPALPASLSVGDKVVVRLTIRTDRDMEYVSLKDLRAGCFEPAVQQSGFMSAGGLLYYHSPRDVSENFYFDRLPQGTYVLEYAAYVARSGQYSNGTASLQCLYAPEFVSHTEGGIILVQE